MLFVEAKIMPSLKAVIENARQRLYLRPPRIVGLFWCWFAAS